jgi:hypothetical protein
MDAMTLTICIFFLLIGFVLGLRFTFLILYPATIFAAIGIAAESSASSDGIGATMLTLALGATSLQMGYILAIIMGALIASSCAVDKLAPSIEV